ncbi:unnamed protein product [Lampetra fluviatilis]
MGEDVNLRTRLGRQRWRYVARAAKENKRRQQKQAPTAPGARARRRGLFHDLMAHKGNSRRAGGAGASFAGDGRSRRQALALITSGADPDPRRARLVTRKPPRARAKPGRRWTQALGVSRLETDRGGAAATRTESRRADAAFRMQTMSVAQTQAARRGRADDAGAATAASAGEVIGVASRGQRAQIQNKNNKTNAAPRASPCAVHGYVSDVRRGHSPARAVPPRPTHRSVAATVTVGYAKALRKLFPLASPPPIRVDRGSGHRIGYPRPAVTASERRFPFEHGTEGSPALPRALTRSSQGTPTPPIPAAPQRRRESPPGRPTSRRVGAPAGNRSSHPHPADVTPKLAPPPHVTQFGTARGRKPRVAHGDGAHTGWHNGVRHAERGAWHREHGKQEHGVRLTGQGKRYTRNGRCHAGYRARPYRTRQAYTAHGAVSADRATRGRGGAQSELRTTRNAEFGPSPAGGTALGRLCWRFVGLRADGPLDRPRRRACPRAAATAAAHAQVALLGARAAGHTE